MKKLSTLLCVLALAPGLGCKKKSESKNQAPKQAAATTPTVPANRPPPVRRTLGVISVDEVKALLPTPDGSRVLKPVAKAQVGERVESAFCYNNGQLTDLAEKVKAKLTAAGWTMVTTREHPQLKDRVGVSAQKQPYILTGTLQRGQWPDCVGDKGQTYVSLGIHKIETQAMPANMPPGAPPSMMGATGGAPGKMPPGMNPMMGRPPFAPGAPGMQPGAMRPPTPIQPGQPPTRPAAPK